MLHSKPYSRRQGMHGVHRGSGALRGSALTILAALTILLSTTCGSALSRSCVGLPDGPTKLLAPSGVAYNTASYSGLTLLAKMDGRLTTWAYSSSLWTSIGTYNDSGSMALDLVELRRTHLM